MTQVVPLIHEGRTCQDRKSTRLNSSHGYISYAVFCLKKKKKYIHVSDKTPLTQFSYHALFYFYRITYYYLYPQYHSDACSDTTDRFNAFYTSYYTIHI